MKYYKDVVGASSTKYLVEVVLTVDKTAGWEEYEKLGLGQIEDLGFDSIKLDNSYIVFSPRRIKITVVTEVRKSMSIPELMKIYSSGNSLVIVDIQPSYESGINFDVAEMLLQAKEYNKVLVLYNGEDLGMESADAIKAWYADKLIESGLDYEEIESEFDHFRFYEKNYGFFRDIMDSNKCFMQTDIVKLIKFMLANNVNDIRELDEEQVKSLDINDLVFDELDNYGFHIPDLASELPNWAGSDIVGGPFDECIAEVLLLAKAQGLTFNLRREFIYGG